MHVRFLFNVIVLEFWILQLNTAIRVRYTPDTYPRSILSEFLLISRIFLLRPYFRKYWIRPSPVRHPKPPWKNSQQLKRDISCDRVVCMVDPWKKKIVGFTILCLWATTNQKQRQQIYLPRGKAPAGFLRHFVLDPAKSQACTFLQQCTVETSMVAQNVHKPTL